MNAVNAMSAMPRWTPEDPRFRDGNGRRVARRNLWLSIPALTLSFVVWMLWSAVVVHLPAAGFGYSTNQLFWLTALPALCGATLRIFYAFAVPIIGGRRFTALATASLLLPAFGIGFAVQDPRTPYELMVALALLCGLGGGNFAGAMANISFFYPNARKGYALGLSAGLGHLGVPLVQLAVPLVIAVSLFGGFGGAPQSTGQGPVWLQNAGFVWVPFIVLSALAAWFGMDDLADETETRAGFAEQAVIFTRKHNWLMCWLYLGTFGSFIGYAAGLPMLVQSQFHDIEASQAVWLGPLLGALLRPLGGWLADHLGGARVTFWSFVAMALGTVAVLLSLPQAEQGGSFAGFAAGFGVLFAAAGLGNGSTFRMIPAIFVGTGTQTRKNGSIEAAGVLGFASAIGAYGGFFIPKAYGSAIALTGGPQAALLAFVFFYLTCIAVTWWHYSRRNAPMPC